MKDGKGFLKLYFSSDEAMSRDGYWRRMGIIVYFYIVEMWLLGGWIGPKLLSWIPSFILGLVPLSILFTYIAG